MGRPSGVKSSITSSLVPAGTVAANGIVTTVPDCAFVTLTVPVAICVRVPPGKCSPGIRIQAHGHRLGVVG